MKVLYTCTYSSGISGVWNRVYHLGRELIKKGHQVYVFSSDIEAGTSKKVSVQENKDGIIIYRFNTRSIGSKNALDFSQSDNKMKEKLKEISPDIVDCQTYRHSEGNIISKECNKLNIPCLLTTHAPFVSLRVRGLFLSSLVWLYDILFSRSTLKRFKKIIAITKWEMPYLNKLGIKDENIVYIPNGIPEEFFKNRRSREENKILFFGRLSPVKDIETLIRAMKIIKNKKIVLDITGPAEEIYKQELISLIKKEKLEKIAIFSSAIFKLKEKIRKIDSSKIFVLPSKREGMPQSIIEAMSREKLIISSDTEGGTEIIKNMGNGIIFHTSEEKDLAEKINFALDKQNKKIIDNLKKNALKSVSDLNWKNISEKIEGLYKSCL